MKNVVLLAPVPDPVLYCTVLYCTVLYCTNVVLLAPVASSWAPHQLIIRLFAVSTRNFINTNAVEANNPWDHHCDPTEVVIQWSVLSPPTDRSAVESKIWKTQCTRVRTMAQEPADAAVCHTCHISWRPHHAHPPPAGAQRTGSSTKFLSYILELETNLLEVWILQSRRP